MNKLYGFVDFAFLSKKLVNDCAPIVFQFLSNDNPATGYTIRNELEMCITTFSVFLF